MQLLAAFLTSAILAVGAEVLHPGYARLWKFNYQCSLGDEWQRGSQELCGTGNTDLLCQIWL